MGELTEFLKTQNVEADGYIQPLPSSLPKNTQYSFSDFNKVSNQNLKEIDFEGDTNLASLENVRNDLRAQQQSSGSKFINSIGQGLGTFGTALASTVTSLASGAIALGAEAVDATLLEGDQVSGMDIFLNNPVTKSINDFDKYLKEEVVPTYYTKEQQESLFSASFGTDALNGLGFLASNVIPMGFVSKSFGGLAKMARVAKANPTKFASLIDKAVDVGELGLKESQILSNTAKYLDKAGPVTGALVGRLGESSMEAYGAYENILTNGGTEEQAKQARNNVFLGNMALAASDLAQFTRWFKGDDIYSRIVQQGGKNVVKTETKKELLGSFVKESLQEAGEEGFQFLLSKGAENSAMKGKGFLEGMSEASGDLFTTVEGQRSMLLGALLGGGMGTGMKIKGAKDVQKQLESAATELNQVGAINDKYIETPDGQKILNPEFTKTATRFMMYEDMKSRAVKAEDQQAYDLAEKMQFAEIVAAKTRTGQYEDYIDELKELAHQNNIYVPYKYRKDEIIDLVNEFLERRKSRKSRLSRRKSRKSRGSRTTKSPTRISFLRSLLFTTTIGVRILLLLLSIQCIWTR
jgi:hypothetical protein